jgi:hypothetical protein
MSSCLVEPVICAQFWRNRNGDALRVELLAIEGTNCIDIRVWRADRDGVMRPVREKGITCTVSKLPELARALLSAQRKAEELGLLPPPPAESRAR